MFRFLELLLFVAPFLAFALWRVLAPRGGPSPRVLAISAGVLLLLIFGLAWFRQEGALPRGSEYVPPQWQNGRIVPGHGVPR